MLQYVLIYTVKQTEPSCATMLKDYAWLGWKKGAPMVMKLLLPFCCGRSNRRCRQKVGRCQWGTFQASFDGKVGQMTNATCIIQ